MQLDHQPIQIPEGEWASYPSDGQRPDAVFEIYHHTDGAQTAALATWVDLGAYLPSKLRWCKRRKFIEARGAAVLEQVVQHHFPSARYISTHEGAIAEFSIILPHDVAPSPIQVEDRLLTETNAGEFYDQLHNPDSAMNRELRHRLQVASVGTEWQKYFAAGLA